MTHTIRIADPASTIPIRVHPAVSPNGDGINDELIIEGIRDYPNNKVKIFGRNGIVLWEGTGYDNQRVAFGGVSSRQVRMPTGTYFYIVEINDNGTIRYDRGYFVLRY